METINELLDEAKDKLGGISDYKLSEALGITRQGISTARQRDRMADDVATRLAVILERDEAELIAIANYWRASEELRKVWERISKLATASAAAMLLFCLPFSANQATPETVQFIHYAKLKRWLKSLALQPIHC